MGTFTCVSVTSQKKCRTYRNKTAAAINVQHSYQGSKVLFDNTLPLLIYNTVSAPLH